jgi:hypothetical protein
MEMMVFNIYVFGTGWKFWRPCHFECAIVVLKGLTFTTGLVSAKLNPAVINSWRKSIVSIASLKAVDNDTYSLSVELRVTSVWILDAHDIGMPAYLVTKPVRDQVVALSSQASSKLQFPAKPVSA